MAPESPPCAAAKSTDATSRHHRASRGTRSSAIMWNRCIVVAFATLILLTARAPRAGAGGTPAQNCASRKIKAAGKTAACLLGVDARVAGGQGADSAALQACRDKLGAPLHGAFALAEVRGG